MHLDVPANRPEINGAAEPRQVFTPRPELLEHGGGTPGARPGANHGERSRAARRCLVFKKLIVGVDFSPLSERAASAAVELARGIGAEVVLVHVIAPGADYADPARFVAEVRPGIEDQLREMAARLGATGARVDWGVVDGHPAEAIATFADRWGGDMIVTGTAGRTGVSRMLLGSVAERLVRIARVPVLVVGPESK